MKVKASSQRMSDIMHKVNHHSYDAYFSDFEYDMCLEDDKLYTVVGLTQRSGATWIYAFPEGLLMELSVFPLVLFDVVEPSFDCPMFMKFVHSRSDDMELVPAELYPIDYWFEKYIDEVPYVLEVVAKMYS